MSKKAMIIIGVLVAVIIIGFILGFVLLRRSSTNASEPVDLEKHSITIEEMYSNVKNSKKIVKLQISIETTNEKEVEILANKSYLIKDIANKIIRNSEESDLAGKEGQVKLQELIKEDLLETFKSQTISDVYFDQYVIQ